MLFLNPRATRADYPPELSAIMNIAQAHQSREWLSSWRGIHPNATPLYDLPDAAARCQVGRLCLKDESVRSPLGSFKATLNKPSKISAQTWMTQFFGLLCLSRGPFGQFAGR